MTQKTLNKTELLTFFTDKGVEVSKLVVVYVGPDTLIGETNDPNSEVIGLKNPKRIFRLSQMQSGGLVLSYMLGDWDFMETGIIYVRPQAWYHLLSEPDSVIEAVLNLYREFLNRKVLNKAEEAGLVLPTIESPFRKK
ncbi:MAG: hypothetical protein E6R04_11740 [Spirochaetes bacterium]|nr:MAG: hypothetical protein E6R04_11740 [Spirochaetota bacterium]